MLTWILGYFWSLPRGVSPRLEWGHAGVLSSLPGGCNTRGGWARRRRETAAGPPRHWIIPVLEGLKKSDEPDFQDKMIVVFDVFMAVFQYRSGDRKGAEDSLRKAKSLAVAFDAEPDYAANRVKYVREPETTNAHDLLGKTAMDAVEYVLHDKDPELRKLWREVRSHET